MNMAADIEQTLRRFLAAFRDLEWTPFLAAFAEDATVFFPFPEQPRLVVGKSAVAVVFESFFSTARRRQPAGPPYLTLDPIDLRISVHGRTALVTFCLADPEVLCRRSLIMVRQDRMWRIYHLHASNVPGIANGA